MMQQNILIIDDEPQIRKLLRINLENNDFRVVEAETGQEGTILAASHPPSLIILDLGLPDRNGHEVLLQLREWYNSPIIILSVIDNEEDIIRALDNGASDYLTKPFRTGELMARIRSALKRDQSILQETKMQFGEIAIDLSSRVVTRSGEIIKLTSTEYSLMLLFVKNHGKVLTHRYILKEVWGPGYQSETQYLRVYLTQLRKKLERDPTDPSHFITESGVGYRFQ